MATKFYLHDAANSGTGTFPTGTQSGTAPTVTWTGATTMKSMNLTKGSSQVAATNATSGSSSAQKDYLRTFVSPPLQATTPISAQTLTFFNGQAEDNLQANFWVNGLYVYVWRPSNGSKVGVIFSNLGSIGGAEPTSANTEQINTFTTGTTTAVTPAIGDVIIVEVWSTFTQGNTTVRNPTFYYDGTTDTGTQGTAISSAASYIQFNTDTLSLPTNATVNITGVSGTKGAGTVTVHATAKVTLTGAVGTGFANVGRPSSYSYQRSITIDYTKVGSTQTNFPLLVIGTFSYLATTANGGKVTNNNGYDIGFFADAGLTTKLDWGLAKYTPSTGYIEAWIRIPSLSGSVNTVIYCAYGNAAITTDQSNKTGVWADYTSVLHMDGSTLSTGGVDVTSNANSFTSATSVTWGAAGQIGDSASFTSSSSAASTGTNGFGTTSACAISQWVYVDPSTVNTNYPSLVGYGVNLYTSLDPSGRFYFTVTAAGVPKAITVNTALSTGVWHHLVAVYDGTQLLQYIDGSLTTPLTPVSETGTVNSLGNTTLGGNGFVGSYDEVRLRPSALSASWVAAEYANQNSPTTFYTLGSETVNSGSKAYGSANAYVVGALASGRAGTVTASGTIGAILNALFLAGN